jgi:hypothetical protein
MRGYGWPWIAYSGSVSWDTPMDLLGTGATPIYTHTAINAVQWLRSDPTFNASTLFLIPAACNIAWWGALIYLVHRALTPSPESAGRRGVPLRWSVRGLLLLQLLAAVAIGVGDRW